MSSKYDALLEKLEELAQDPGNPMPNTTDSAIRCIRELLLGNVPMPIAAVEIQEHLYAEHLSKLDVKELAISIRKCFYFQRFAIMNWLLMNGVSIPAPLLSDQTHPVVGSQYPDQNVKSRAS